MIATITSVFEPAEGQEPFDYVFDLSGEPRHDRPDEVRLWFSSFAGLLLISVTKFQIKNTYELSRQLGLEAAKRKIKSYVRLTLPFYVTSDKGGADEAADIKTENGTGTWWHEALRGLAAIQEYVLLVIVYGDDLTWSLQSESCCLAHRVCIRSIR